MNGFTPPVAPSPTLMEHTLRVIRAHVDMQGKALRPVNARSLYEAVKLAVDTPMDTLDEIAAYPKLETLFPDEFRAARATFEGPTEAHAQSAN